MGNRKQKIKDFTHTKFHLIWQPLACAIFLLFVLFGMSHVSSDTVMWAVGSSCLASSGYIVFVTPKSHVAKPKRIMGGYVIAIFIAEIVREVTLWLGSAHCCLLKPIALTPHVFWAAAVVAVALAIFLMITIKFEHPPAAGVALITVLEIRDPNSLAVILLGAIVLASVAWLLRGRLKSLV